MPTYTRLDLTLAETWDWVFQCLDETGAPLDLTPDGANVRVRVSTAEALLLDLEVGTGVTITNPAQGMVAVSVSPVMQAAVPAITAGIFAHDAQAILPGGVEYPQQYGVAYVNDSLFSLFP